MSSHHTRRGFFRASAAGAAAGLGEWAGLLPLGPATAAESRVTPDLVRFGPDVEPLVRLIEEAPREKCPRLMLEQLRAGLPYRNFLAALYLANIRTRFVNHPLAVLHSADQLALDLPPRERLLPVLWALDSFKFHQQGDKAEFCPALRPLAGRLPAPENAAKEFHEAMAAFDGGRAERAIAVLARGEGRSRVAELLWHYGARDWTFIGHLAIWAANCWRPLEAVGWQHAEPVLRVVARNLVGEDKTLKGQPYAANRERVRKALAGLPAGWAQAGSSPGFTKELLALIREHKSDEACELAATRLAAGKVQAGAVWDAVHLAAGEMVLCAQKNSEPLHANTAANALHYAFESSGETANRLLILLQAVGWMCLYRSALARKGWLKEPVSITELPAADVPERPADAIDAILAHLSFGPGGKPTADPVPGWKGTAANRQPWRLDAASKVFAFARRFGDPQPLWQAAYRLLPFKADWDPHRIKFPVAARENCGWVSTEWRPHMLAAASCSFLGADAPDTELAKQLREALRGL